MAGHAYEFLPIVVGTLTVTTALFAPGMTRTERCRLALTGLATVLSGSGSFLWLMAVLAMIPRVRVVVRIERGER